jgi:cysteine desulfurase
MKKVYLDYAATTPADERVLEAMTPYFREKFGNPSSIHSYGQEAKRAIEESRSIIASSIGSSPSEIIFTGSGTESNNLAIKGTAWSLKNRGSHIITSSIEHHSVLETCHYLEKEGFRVTYLPVDSYGMVDPDDVTRSITDDTILLSIMHANNEVGTIQPVSEIGAIAHDRDVLFHIDAIQTFCHIPISLGEINADMVSFSAHKLYGPKGTGALYVKKNLEPVSLLHGGSQESGMRASTHNVASIVGFSAAVEIAGDHLDREYSETVKSRDMLTSGILDNIENTSLNGHREKRLPGNVSVSFHGLKSEVVLLGLDMKGIACSTGSACNTETIEPSHVLTAMGIEPEKATSTLRFSVGRSTTEEDIAYVIEAVTETIARLRSI